MPEFMTIPEVARLLRLGERTVYSLARDGRIGGTTKVGNQWRFEKRRLLAWLQDGGEAKPTRGGETQAR